MIEDLIQPLATSTRPMWRVLLGLLVVGGTLLVALPSGPAEAAITLTVNSTDDQGEPTAMQGDGRCDWDASTAGRQCTLRAAIEEANATANSGGPDEIIFAIGGTTAVKTISPTSALPTITDPVIIDGYTQSGASPNTLDEGNDAVLNVVLDGLNAGAGVIGLTIEASDSTIKGLVIRRFDDYGVQILSVGATSNRLEGNYIGVNRDGTTDRGNGAGVYIESDSNTVGGTAAGARNVISGNDGTGVFIGTAATDNKIEGNYIGTTSDGTAELGNVFHGMYVAGDSNTIGGTAAGARNVISGNDGFGVFISGLTGGNENRVEGNYVGTTANGSGDLGNTQDGVSIQNGADLTAIGGTASKAGNRIAHNGGNGVLIVGTDSVGNHILSNSIYNNAELGIDLGGINLADGVTANDTGDPDTGPNNLQNFPVIRSATRSSATSSTTAISGRLNSNPTQDFLIQCFLTNWATASSQGEGYRLQDTTIVSTNANGSARFSCISFLPILGQKPGQTVSATAMNVATGDSSEFSKPKAITIGP